MDPKTKQFNLMLSASDFEALSRIADAQGLNRSQFLRRAIATANDVQTQGMPRCFDGTPCPAPHICASPNIRRPHQ